MIQYGRHSYHGNPAVHFYLEDNIDITVGAYCSIAAGVEFLPGGMHQLDKVSTYPWQRLGHDYPPAYVKGPIRVGNDVWIGVGARILGGVTIGNGAIVAAWAVVSRDVPAYHIAAGNPARHYPRPHAAYADQLEAIGWWDWPDDDPRLRDVRSLSVAEFVAKHG